MSVASPVRWMRLLLLVMAFAGVVFGEESRSDRRVSIDVAGAPVADVFGALADEMGVRLLMDTALTGTLSMRLDNVGVWTALAAACDSVGCSYSLSEGDRPILHVMANGVRAAERRPAQRDASLAERSRTAMALSLKEAPLEDVMRTVATILECDLDLRVDGKRKFTARMENVSVIEVLDRIDETLALRSSIEEGADPGTCVLRVRAPSE